MGEPVDIGIEKLMETLRERGQPDGLSLEERRQRMEDIGDRFPAPETAMVEALEAKQEKLEGKAAPKTEAPKSGGAAGGGGDDVRSRVAAMMAKRKAEKEG